MGRPKEERYWNQVTKEADRTWKCNRCGRQFSGGVSRIKAHVDRIPGKGISICSASPNDNHLQPQSQQTANPMNPGEVAAEDDDHEIVDAFFGGLMQHSINIISQPINLPGGSAAVAQSNNDGFVSDEIKKLNELLHDLTFEEDDIKGELEWLKSEGKQSKTQVDDWLNELQELRNEVGDCLNLAMVAVHYFNENYPHYLGQMQQLTAQVSELKKKKPVVLSNEFVGKDFEKNVKKMWELVGDEKVLMIGIHGMGGVGKTCLATHMETQIIRKGTFNHVIWVTVSRDNSILKLQEDIARRIGAKLNGDDDERTRAAHLSSALSEKGKWVLILDDVWKFIDLEKVGIPRCRINGSKLITTSRLKHVLRQMGCPRLNIITMDLLSDSEGLELFLVKLGEDHRTPATLPYRYKIFKIAMFIARECNGLPLAISVMARTMKGIDSIHQWRHALNKLERGEMGEEMKEEVFQVLKLSYDNLMDTRLQNSFLHCALYFEILDYDKMIMMLVDSGAINGRRSLNDIFDEGHTILNELEDHSLLPRFGNMQNSVKNMACHILKESQRCIVRCGKKLTGIPNMQEWSADLELVSLDTNEIEEIPAGTSPKCPRLSTLILRNNCISSIPECFFTHMKSLAILDLSQNRSLTSLPDSLSDLTCLVSLLLHHCYALAKVPPLGRLQKLSRLVISDTQVEVVPGLEMLTNLTWLDLSYNEKLRLESGRVLRGLTKLQYLDLFKAALLNVEIEDVQGLTTLEYFVAGFNDCKSYDNYVASIWNTGSAPKSYLLYLGSTANSEWIFESKYDTGPRCDDHQIVHLLDCEESPHLLPKDLTKIFIECNPRWKSLCDALSNITPSSLENIQIARCTEMKSVLCSFGNCSFCSNLNNLQSLQLYGLESLTVICKEDVAVTDTTTQPLKPNAVFSHLRHLEISSCNGIETLVTAGLLPQLQNLQTLTVEGCRSLRQIFAASSSGADSDDAASTIITLPNLTSLYLWDLPMLETVCKGIIISESLPKFVIRGCPKLESRSPFEVSSSSFTSYT
ncbi:probable disease resistance protein At5g43730 isoform X1 [Arachis duranensis]|uniref:Probable disease resistance protein At5g43730 isoform X1 n=1 Tax=Arachis duranensis TaxID=130453 RepID=A0A6P5NJU2_ARADU|nr:probable disease resistance protein At5g43730 isoform X1 [Arachis duranensis]XP_052116932.1 probable disease resistance protein At5g43730 isoform X1 [Arachis duranensis]